MRQSLQILGEETIGTLNPPARMLPSEWSRGRFLSKEYTAKWGFYRLSLTPWCKKPMDDSRRDDVQMIVLKWGRQLGKSTIEENIIGYHIDCDPAPILMVQPTVEAAQAFSKERLVHTIRDTPSLHSKVSDAPTRDSTNTIQVKTFPGGSLALMGANSPTGLGMRSRRVVLFDEVNRYPPSAGAEGDPVNIGIKTTETYSNSVIYLVSTPTIRGASRITDEYDKTDKQMWFCKCPHCGKWQTLEWEQVRWARGKPEEAHIVCNAKECGRDWSERQRANAVRNGEWRPTARFRGKRGFFLNGLVSLFSAKKGFRTRLHQAAQEFIEAEEAERRGDNKKMIVFQNCYLANDFEEKGEKADPNIVAQRAENYTPTSLPQEVIIIVGGGDVQKNRIEVEWQGFGLGEESWGIEKVVINGDTERPEVWSLLSRELGRSFRREDGLIMRPTAFGLDTHFRSKESKAWCKTAGGTGVYVYAMLGATTDQQILLVKRFNPHYQIYIWTVDTCNAKDTLMSRLNIKVKGPGFQHFPKEHGYTADWYQQYTCEKAVIRYKDGFPKRYYVKDDAAANEAVDMRVYALGAYEALRPKLEVIKKLLDAEVEAMQKGPNLPKKPQGPEGPMHRSIGGSFVGGFTGPAVKQPGKGWL